MVSLYPASIDNDITLQPLIDLNPITGEIVDQLRTTIIAIETTLGTNPNGNSNVSTRLSNLEIAVAAVPIITLAGDLDGYINHQTVVGIQNKPVSNANPAFGQSLFWNGISWIPSYSGSGKFNITSTTTSPYTPSSTDVVIAVGTLSAAFVVNMPATPAMGATYYIKDARGSAGTYNITINGNGHNIDDASSIVLDQNYMCATLSFDGSRWLIL